MVFLCGALMMGGCAVDLPFQKEKKAAEEDLSDAESPEAEAEAEPLVYYVGVERLRLYEEPRTSANFVADLEQYQKLYRYKIEKGFAWVKVDGTDMAGWVINAKLIWRLPEPGVAEPVEQPPEVPSPTSAEATDANTPEGETAPTAAPTSPSEDVDPSRFDAF
jgi:hypothetical protein